MITFRLRPIVEGRCGCNDPNCTQAGKHPAEPWKDIPADRPELRPTPDAGVGIATGERSGCFVVDLDVKNGINGLDELAKLGDVPATYTVRTPSGGFHLYFKHPGFRVRNSGPKSNPLAPGVDVRGDGGYVVAPGSPHKNGGRYEVAFAGPIVDAPAWLLENPKLRHAKDTQTTARPVADVEQSLGQRVPRDWRVAKAKAWLEKQPAAVEGYGGDGHTFQVLTRAVHEFCLTDADMIADAFVEWNARCEPPWSGSQWAHKVETALHRSTLPFKSIELLVQYKTAQLEAGHADSGAPAPTPTPFPLTDSGNAERFAVQHGDKVRFVADWNRWLTWDGTRWQPDKTGAVARLAKETARTIIHEIDLDDDDDWRKKVRAWASKSEARQGRENMVALARSEKAIAASPEAFDKEPWLLNVANGTIDLCTGELRPHAREDMITKLAPVTYDPNASAPLWDAFLSQVMGGNADLIGYLQRFIGYALTGVIREHVFAFSYGGGRNGKGCFHRTIAKMLGDYSFTASDRLFFVSKDAGHPTSTASLLGTRFVVCSELNPDKRFDEELLKRLTGGDVLNTRRLFENEWELKPTCKLFFQGNSKPIIRGLDDAIWSRVRLIPWNVSFQGREDTALEDKLASELPGILMWAVRGCAAWRDHGLGKSPDVDAATNEYREESDPLGDFFSLRCEFAPDYKIGRPALRKAYDAWCIEHGATAVGHRKLGEALRRRGVVDGGSMREAISSTPVNAWRGVRLRSVV